MRDTWLNRILILNELSSDSTQPITAISGGPIGTKNLLLVFYHSLSATTTATLLCWNLEIKQKIAPYWVRKERVVTLKITFCCC